MFRRPGVAILEVSGEDRVRFLNGLVTCQVNELEPGQGVYGFFTDAKGHVLADVLIYALEDRHWLELPRSELQTIADHMQRYIVADRVQLIPRPELSALALAGPEAKEVTTELGTAILGDANRMTVDERVGTPSFTIWTPEESLQEVNAKLLETCSDRLIPVSEYAVETVRVEAGTPRFGIDFDSSNLPQETSVDEAVNYEKGCYLGQEIVARLHYRGQAAKSLQRLRFETDVPPAAGTELLLDGRPAGVVTSAVLVPGADQAIGLGMIQRRAFETDARLEDEQGRVAEIVGPVAGQPV